MPFQPSLPHSPFLSRSLPLSSIHLLHIHQSPLELVGLTLQLPAAHEPQNRPIELQRGRGGDYIGQNLSARGERRANGEGIDVGPL